MSNDVGNTWVDVGNTWVDVGNTWADVANNVVKHHLCYSDFA